MYKIAQADIFYYLTRKESIVYHGLKELADIVSCVFSVSLDKSAIHNIIHRRKKGRNIELKPDSIDKFYRALFGEKEWDKYALKAMLSDVQEFVKKNDIFEEWTGNTFEEYVKGMFVFGLTNIAKDRSKYVPLEREDTPAHSQSEDSPAYPLHDDELDPLDTFVGREKLLNEIQKRLDQHRCVVLSGMGGIGKSQLAIEFAARNKDRYSLRQLVRSEKGSSFQDAVLALRFEGLKDEKEPQNERWQRRWELLRRHDGRTLIIIDNVDDGWTDIKEFYDLRRMMKFHLVITSRLSDDVFKQEFCLPVDPLSHDEQRELFCRHCKVGLQEFTPAQDRILNEILRRIDGHTLLIEVMAKIMYHQSVTLEDMRDWLDGQNAEYTYTEDGVIKNPKEVLHKILLRVPMTPEQTELLRRLAFLPPEGISRGLLLRKLCRGASGDLSFLENHSLVTRERDQIRIQPVIRMTVQENIQPAWWEWSVHSEFLRKIQKVMDSEADKKNLTSLCLLARGIWEKLDKSKVPPELWDCLSAIAEHCKSAYQYETALRLYKSLSKIEENAKTKKRIELHLQIGSIYQQKADYRNAKKHYWMALGLARRNDNWRGSCFSSLGVVYRKEAYYTEAEECLKKALECYTPKDLIISAMYDFGIIPVPDTTGIVTAPDSHDEDDNVATNVVTTQDDLGVVYRHLGEVATEPDKSEYYQKAEKIAREVLALREKLGADEKALAYSHHRIGSACYCLGDYETARKEHEEAAELRSDMPQSHNWIGKDLLQLARQDEANGKLDEAKEHLDKAKTHLDKSLNLRKEHLGEHHPEVAKSLMSLGEYHEQMGELSRAIEYTQEAYDIREKGLRENHPYTIQTKRRLDELKNREM